MRRRACGISWSTLLVVQTAVRVCSIPVRALLTSWKFGSLGEIHVWSFRFRHCVCTWLQEANITCSTPIARHCCCRWKPVRSTVVFRWITSNPHALYTMYCRHLIHLFKVHACVDVCDNAGVVTMMRWMVKNLLAKLWGYYSQEAFTSMCRIVHLRLD